MKKFLALALLAPTLAAQNVSHPPPATPANFQTMFVPGLDIEGLIGGSFQHMTSGSDVVVSMSTTACNPGSVVGTWQASPDVDHPLITQMYTRLHNNRFEQINDYSYGKHSFGSTNSGGCGLSCQGGGFSQLGLGCSDTYSSGLNWDRGDLGPLTEWNAFTGEWVFFGSHLDTGFPVTTPNGSETSINPANSRQFRCRIPASKVGVAGAKYFAQAYYLHKWEPEANRENNMSSFRVSLNTAGISTNGPRQFGSVLNRYEGARVESAVNEVGGVVMDGRFYVGVHVSANPDGTFRYEYAVHNRDNHAGNVEFRIPVAPGSTTTNFGTKDVDLNGIDNGNNWSGSQVGNEIVFSAPGNARPQGWNTIYNFWFDSSAAPVDGSVTIVGDPSRTNPGANPNVVVASNVPGLQPNVDLGGGCSSATTPELVANNRATVPNPDFNLTLSNVATGQPAALHLNYSGASVPFNGCDVLNPILAFPGGVTTGSSIDFSISIPFDAAAEGRVMHWQGIVGEAGGPVLGLAALSNRMSAVMGALVPVPPPVIDNVSPTSPAPGATVTISGSGFSPYLTLDVDGQAVTPTAITDSSITFTNPAGVACGGSLTVTNPDSTNDAFVYNPDVAIAALPFSSGPAAGGSTFVVTGNGFGPGVTVTIAGNPVTILTATLTGIVGTTPPGTPGAATVIVTMPNGCSDQGTYTYQ